MYVLVYELLFFGLCHFVFIIVLYAFRWVHVQSGNNMNQKTHYLTQDPEAIRYNTIFLQGAFLNNFFDKSEKEKKCLFYVFYLRSCACISNHD